MEWNTRYKYRGFLICFFCLRAISRTLIGYVLNALECSVFKKRFDFAFFVLIIVRFADLSLIVLPQVVFCFLMKLCYVLSNSFVELYTSCLLFNFAACLAMFFV